ncbi:glycosyl transferase [Sulfurovum riftiae]|uniref:Glycosyl transferase n=1 Tax=Sulfurovum riftiae TaxID=1630136 RepID=A0A151CGV9_9BACT|nr:glycosyl transferase [Sulfurovum riftiae]KYJ86756.1 glycosyl transferase [Sulfurovum riftiae]
MTPEAFLPYLKCVGTGPKRNRDLTKEEMKTVIRAFLEQEVVPEQVAAFMLGWRVKGESIDEFAGAIEVFDEFIRHAPLANSIEFGYPYDGKVKNPYIFPLTAQYLEPFGINLSLHGGLLQPAKGGITLKEVCDNVPLPSNVHYYDRSEYFPELYRFSEVRAKLGLRSSFNTIEKLLGITQSDTAIIGAFHKPFVQKYIDLYKDRYKKLIIIKGNEGTPEIFGKCAVTIVENGEVEEIKVDPKACGIDYVKSTQPITLEESLKQTKAPSDVFLELAKFNAAVILFLNKRTDTIEEGLRILY